MKNKSNVWHSLEPGGTGKWSAVDAMNDPDTLLYLDLQSLVVMY